MQAERRGWWLGLVPAVLFIVAAGLAGLLGDTTVSNAAAASGRGFTEDPKRLIVYGLAYFWALMWLLPRSEEALNLARRTWPLWLLVAYAGVSMLWSQIPFKVFINTGHYAGETLVALAAVCAVRDDLRRLSLMLVGTLGVVIVLSMVAVRLGWPNCIDIESGRWAGTTGNSNILGLMSAMLLGAALNVFLTPGSWFIRLGCAGLAVAAVLTLRSSGSATSLVFALVLTAGTVWLQFGRKDASTGLSARMVSGVFMLCLAGAVAVGFLPETFQADTWLKVLGKSETLSGRTDVWAFAWHLFQQRPFFGYSFDSLASVLGGFAKGVGHMHNGYLDLLVRGGIVGLVIYLIALLRAMYRLLQVSARTPAAAFWFMFLAADLAYELAEASLMRPVHVIWLAFLLAATVAERSAAGSLHESHERHSHDRQSYDRPTGAVAIPNLLRSCVIGFLLVATSMMALSPAAVLAATPKPKAIKVTAGRVMLKSELQVVEVLPEVPVSPLARNLFSTPTGLCGDKLIVASVEDGSPFPNRLVTVVRIGERDENGGWQWRRIVLEPRTLPDITHTQPSVGIDPRQHVHVAYNMHNMPWQYVRSRTPCSIDDFEFLGRPMSDEDLYTAFEKNSSPWYDIGSAAIPANQITYPAFFNDRNGDLYVTYRFAVRPARPWLERAFGGGIARFDAGSQQWLPVGGNVPLSSSDVRPHTPDMSAHPFAWEPGWTVYHPRLWFDRDNAMYVTWMWREEQAGIETSRPSFAMRPESQASFRRADGSPYELPVRLSEAGVIDAFEPGHVFHAGTSITTDERGAPLVVLESHDGTPRTLATYDTTSKRWVVAERTPYGAPWVVCEDDGTCWAYATGPRIFRRTKDEARWQMVYEQDGYCDPKPLHMLGAHRRFLHVTRCDWTGARVIELVDR